MSAEDSLERDSTCSWRRESEMMPGLMVRSRMKVTTYMDRKARTGRVAILVPLKIPKEENWKFTHHILAPCVHIEYEEKFKEKKD